MDLSRRSNRLSPPFPPILQGIIEREFASSPESETNKEAHVEGKSLGIEGRREGERSEQDKSAQQRKEEGIDPRENPEQCAQEGDGQDRGPNKGEAGRSRQMFVGELVDEIPLPAVPDIIDRVGKLPSELIVREDRYRSDPNDEQAKISWL